MTWVRIDASVSVDMPREDALELGEKMLDVADVPGFISASAGTTLHDDECDDFRCEGCAKEGA